MFAVFVFGVTLATPVFSAPQGPNIAERLSTTGDEAGFKTGTNETGVSTIVGRVINAATSLVGVIFVAQMVYAGYLWMTAAGESEQVKKAQQLIRRSIIGLAIILSAWAVTFAVLTRLYQATG